MQHMILEEGEYAFKAQVKRFLDEGWTVVPRTMTMQQVERDNPGYPQTATKPTYFVLVYSVVVQKNQGG